MTSPVFTATAQSAKYRTAQQPSGDVRRAIKVDAVMACDVQKLTNILSC